MSLTTDLDALKAQSADLQSQVAQIATEITAKEQAIAAAAGHSALWDRIKAVVSDIRSAAVTDIANVADGLDAIEAEARHLINL
jgi:cell division protein FtsB